MNDYAGFTPDKVHHSAVDEVVKLAGRLQKDSFNDMTSEDVNGLIECHSESLTNEDLAEMTKLASEEENDENPQEEEIEECGLTLEGLQDMYNVAKDLQRWAQEMDDDMTRAMYFSNLIDGAMTAYKKILAEKKK